MTVLVNLAQRQVGLYDLTVYCLNCISKNRISIEYGNL